MVRDSLMDDEVLLLTVEEARELLGVGKNTIYEIVNHPDCPFIVHHLGRAIRIDKASFLEALKSPIKLSI